MGLCGYIAAPELSMSLGLTLNSKSSFLSHPRSRVTGMYQCTQLRPTFLKWENRAFKKVSVTRSMNLDERRLTPLPLARAGKVDQQ